MAYDGMYGELSTRGAANEVLNLAIATKDQIVAAAEQVDEQSVQVAADALQVAQDKIMVEDDRLEVNAQAIEVQNNATFVAQAISNVVLEDAPQDGQSYSRNNGQWVTGSTEAQFYTADLYWDTVTYGPGNAMAKIYPRQNLSRPILTECYIRRDGPTTAPLVVELKSTDPDSTWKATATLNVGESEGYFTSGTVEALPSTWGMQLVPNPVPGVAPTGVTMHLVWEIEPDPTLLLLK